MDRKLFERISKLVAESTMTGPDQSFVLSATAGEKDVFVATGGSAEAIIDHIGHLIQALAEREEVPVPAITREVVACAFALDISKSLGDTTMEKIQKFVGGRNNDKRRSS